MEVHISTLMFTAWNSHQPWVHYATSCTITSWLVAGRYPVHTSTWNPPISMEGFMVFPIPFIQIPNKILKQFISSLTQCHKHAWLSGLLHIWEVLGSTLSRRISYPNWDFSWFSQPIQAIATNYFHILYSSTFIVILYITQYSYKTEGPCGWMTPFSHLHWSNL